MIETEELIAREKSTLRKEADFFTGFKHKAYVGVLTNERIDTVTYIYPQVIQGVSILYDHIQNNLNLSSEDGYLVRFLEKAYSEGRLVTNEEVEDLERRVQNGDYSKQYEAYARYRERMSARKKSDYGYKKEGQLFYPYVETKNEADALYNKRMYLSRVLGMENQLQAIYGEVDYQKALLTELLLNAPFLDNVVSNGEVSKEARQRHKAFLSETAEFVTDFHPKQRFANFEEATKQYSAQWAEEIPLPKISSFDRPFIDQVYGTAEEMLVGKFDIDKLYCLLRKTIIRRGRLFQATAIQSLYGNFLSLNPTDSTGLSFKDIAGYNEQKSFYETLLEKTAAKDPILNDIRIILAAGEPGLGKSLGVQAFLNALPENARGMMIKMSRGSTEEYDLLMKLAKIHSELDIYAVIEDIDALAEDRLINSNTRKFLEIDSAVDTIPRNFHLIATTNRPDVIDAAIIRPGRTAKILVYEPPAKNEIKEITTLHAKKNGITLSEDIVSMIAEKSDRFTPDEVRHIVWTLRFEGIKDPSEEDINRLVEEIKKKHKIEKQSGLSNT